MQTIALIPAYRPEDRMIPLIKQLRELGFDTVIVDDGSGAGYDTVFDEAGAYAEVLRYSPNRGKGEALKHGLRFIEQNYKAPYTVVTAPSGIEGMEILRKSKVNLVLASTEMSFINGFRIADFIHGDGSLRNIPTFLLTHATVDTDPEIIQKIESSYAQGYLNKPLNSSNALAPLITYLKNKK